VNAPHRIRRIQDAPYGMRLTALPLSALADGVVQLLATDAEGNTSEVGRYALSPVFADGFESP